MKALLVIILALLAPSASPPKPAIVWKPIPFGAQRKAEMAAYAKRHYGVSTWRLTDPKVIVEHYTATDTFSSAYNTFCSPTRPTASSTSCPASVRTSSSTRTARSTSSCR